MTTDNDIEKKEKLRSSLEKDLPPIIARSSINRFLTDYMPQTLANEDSLGIGPKNRIKGKYGKVSYYRDDLIEWYINKKF